jgi:allantoinase
MSQGPARLVGLASKGAIAIGRDADFCVFAPEESFVVEPKKLLHRNPGTPYDGRTLMGVVRSTVLAGKTVDREVARGRLLSRARA